MRSRLAALWLVALFFTLGMLWAGEARAFSLLDSSRIIGPGQWEGNIGAGYEWEDQSLQSAGAPTTHLLRNRYDEVITLGHRGAYIIDPRLIEGVGDLDLDFFQERDKYAGRPEDLNGLLIGYDTSTIILSQKAYTATTFSQLHQSQVTTDFAGDTKTSTSNFGFTARLRQFSRLRDWLPYFSSSLDVRQETADETEKLLGQTYKLNETRRIITYKADKGFQTADLDFNYQFIDDHLTGTNHLAFQTQSAALNYSLGFGPTLNRRWDSHVNYFSRAGNYPETYLWVDEMLRLDHFKNLATIYHYLLTRTTAPGQTVTTQTGIFRLEYRLFKNLFTTLSLQGLLETLPQGRIDTYGFELSPNYERSIAWGGSIYLDTDYRYEVDDNALSGGQIAVTDEPHTAPSSFGPGLGFTLNRSFVVTSTIVMVDTRNGGRIPTVPGVDYEIVAQANLTKIVPLPTSPIINPDDPLEVSYVYQVAPSSRFSTTQFMTTVGARFSWLDLSFEYQDIRQDLLSGLNPFLYRSRSETGHLGLHRQWGPLTGRTDALYEIYDQSFLAYTMQSYEQHLALRPGLGFVLSVTGNESFTDYSAPKQRTSMYDVEGSLERWSLSGNFFSLFGGMRSLYDSAFTFPTENDSNIGLKGTFQWGKFRILPMFSWIMRSWGPVKSSDLHCELRVSRSL